MLQTFLDRLPEGVSVAVTASVPLRMPQPLGPIIDVLGQLGVDAAGSRPGSPSEAVRVLTATVRRRPSPVVLVFDDAHWADDATLDVLTLLARAGTDLPMLLLVAARDREIPPDHPLWPVLAVLRSQGAVVVDLRAEGIEAHREACSIYDRVLRYAHELDPHELASLTSEYAYQLYLVWDLEKAASVAELAVHRWHDLGDAGEEGSALTTLARILAWSDRGRALEAADRAIALLEPTSR